MFKIDISIQNIKIHQNKQRLMDFYFFLVPSLKIAGGIPYGDDNYLFLFLINPVNDSVVLHQQLTISVVCVGSLPALRTAVR